MARTLSGRKAIRLAGFIFRLYHHGRIGISRARNTLDRLATRIEQTGDAHTAERISVVYMRVR